MDKITILITGILIFCLGMSGLVSADERIEPVIKTYSPHPDGLPAAGEIPAGVEAVMGDPAHLGSIIDDSARMENPRDVFVNGTYAYVTGYDSHSLEIINISNPADPVHVGSIGNGTGGALLQYPSSVFVSGDYAYVTGFLSDALEIVDISDPRSPVHTGSILNGDGGALLDGPRDVYVQDTFAYVAVTGSNALEIIDISDPASPVHVSSIGDGTGGALLQLPRSVSVAGDYAYVVSAAGNSLEIVNITSPASPTHQGSITHGEGGAILLNPSSVFVSDNYTYVTSEGGHALEIVDVTDPSAPTHLAVISNGDGGALLNAPSSVFVSGNMACVAATGSNALEIVDVSDPAAPSHAGSLQHGDGGAILGSPLAVVVSGTHALVTGSGSDSLEIADITTPATPLHLGSILHGMGGANLQSPVSVHVSGDHAYIASSLGNGLEIVDVSDPTAPVHAGSIVNGGDVLLNRPTSVYVADARAYVTSEDALEIVDVSDPSAPLHLGSITDGTGGADLGNPTGVQVIGIHAYVTSATTGTLEILDVSDPSAPAHLGSITDGDGGALLNTPVSLFMDGPIAYIASYGDNALEIVDASDPTAPVHLASLGHGEGGALLQGPVGVCVSDNYTFVSGRTSNSLEIVDVSDPTAPVHAGSYQGGIILQGPSAVSVSGNYAQVTGSDSNSLVVVNVTYPAGPMHKGVILDGDGGARLDQPTDVFISGTRGYVTGRDALEIVDIEQLPVPEISVSPSSAPHSAPVDLTVSGYDFRTGIQVSLNRTGFPDILATDHTLISPENLTCQVPITGKAPGLWNVFIDNPNGEVWSLQTLGDAFRITGRSPIVTNVTPSTGYNSTQIAVAVNGWQFRDGATVALSRGAAVKGCPVTAPITANRIQSTLPIRGLSPGYWNISVTNTDGTSHTRKNAFLVKGAGPAPTFSSLSPDSWFNTTSIEVLVNGSQFRTGAVVRLSRDGQYKNCPVSYLNPYRIRCTLPITGMTPGPVNLTVRNTDGTLVTKTDAFTVKQPGIAPRITTLSSTSGYNHANLEVTINGTNFRNGASVTLTTGNGNRTCPLTAPVTPTRITCTFPIANAPAGICALTVRNYDGTFFTRPNAFWIRAAGPKPAITALSPASGYTPGHTGVTITGTNFREGATVQLVQPGTRKDCPVRPPVTPTRITSTFPLTGLSPGTWNLTVTNTDGTAAWKKDAFRILPVGKTPSIMTTSPASGYNSQNAPFRITGSDFRNGVSVRLVRGTVARTGTIQERSSTIIRGTLPIAGAPAGSYNLTVRNADGTFAWKGNAFTVLAAGQKPSVTAINPSKGLATQNTGVVITGTGFRPGAGVKMVRGAGMRNALVKSVVPTRIVCTLPTKGAAPGAWDVRVTNADNTRVTRVGGFTVTATGAATGSNVAISGTDPASWSLSPSSPELAGGPAITPAAISG